MSKEEKSDNIPQSAGFVKLSEEERLRRDIYRPDMEKFRLFTKMLRTNALLKRAVITHK